MVVTLIEKVESSGLLAAVTVKSFAALALELTRARSRPAQNRTERRRPAAADQGYIEWAWAVNAAASVLGAVFAMVIAIHFGLKITLAGGALAYMFALALTSSFAADKAEALVTP